jgi:hypothetical protein
MVRADHPPCSSLAFTTEGRILLDGRDLREYDIEACGAMSA